MDAVETSRSHAGPTGRAWGAACVVVALVAGSAAGSVGCEGKSRLPPVSEASVGGAGGGAVGGGGAGGEGAIGQGAMGAGASGATGAGAGQVGGAGAGAGAPCGEHQPVIGACETSFALDDEYTVVAVRAPDGDEPCFGQLAIHPELITVMLDLEGDVQSLTVGLGLPGVTTSTFTVGETLMVSDASAGSFTFVTLRRDVLETLVGVYTQQGFFGSTLAVAPSEELCFVDDDLGTGGICRRSANAVTATFEGQTSAPVGPGKSAEVGGYTFTSDHYWMEEGLNCNGGLEFLFGYVLSP